VTFAEKWLGRAQGTSTGNLYARLKIDQNGLVGGYVRLNDDRDGLLRFDVVGSLHSGELTLEGVPNPPPEDYSGQKLRITGRINPQGELVGDWSSDVGGEGRFRLYPHLDDQSDPGGNALSKPPGPDQFHTARLELGPIGIDREGIIQLAEAIQKDFQNPVVISVTGETTQNYFLEGFKTRSFNHKRADIVWIRGSDFEAPGLNRVVSVEFGQQTNFAFAQSSDEAWARGKRDMLRQQLRPYERNYATTAKKFGLGLNQFLIAGLLVFLPSFEELWERVTLVFAFSLIAQGMSFLDRRVLRHADIYLHGKKRGAWERLGPSLVSWSAGLLAAILSGLLVAWLEGMFSVGAP
jgi:hypothetical protein